jgi:threonine/homoserine/homoserine lactone efflux protein
MTFILFLQIAFVCLLGAMSPGPSMMVVINNAIFKNKFNGILTAFGHGFGIGIYALFAVIGIGIVIETNIIVFNTLKTLSVIFLFYLGIQNILKRSQIKLKKNNIKFGLKSFIQGFSISILNPKILIWFIAIYSQFMSLNNDIYFNLSLVLIASIVDALWYLLLVNIVTSKGILELLKNKSYLLQRIVGCLFIVISIFLLIDLFK